MSPLPLGTLLGDLDASRTLIAPPVPSAGTCGPSPGGPSLLGAQPGLLGGAAGTDEAPAASGAQAWLLCDESPFLFGLQVLFPQDLGWCPWARSRSPGLGQSVVLR